MDKRLTRSAKPPRPPRAVGARKPPVAGGAPPPGASAPARAASAKLRILAVDDTAKDLKDLRQSLQATHAEVFTCQNGKSALDFLARDMVDLVVVDVLMPEMDGYEVCRHLKHDPRTKDIPVIFVTGNYQTEDKMKGIEVGAWDYICKPIDRQEVEIRVNNAIEIKQARDKLKISTIVPEDQAQEQLRMQQKIADFQHGMTTAHWNYRLGQLCSNFLSEIHYPLNASLSNIKMMMVDEHLPVQTRDQLALTFVNFRQVDQKLRRLLKISDRHPRPSIVHIGQVVNDTAKLLNLEFQYYGIEVTYNIDPACQCIGAESELGRAVLYLLHNALEAVTYRPRIYAEFTNDEEAEVEDMKQIDVRNPKIEISVLVDGSQVNIDICDNGPGVAPENAEQIWDPYFTTKGPPHTGAGLHLARAIARAAEGETDFLSPNEKGFTQFTIALPLFDQALYEQELAEEMEARQAALESGAEIAPGKTAAAGESPEGYRGIESEEIDEGAAPAGAPGPVKLELKIVGSEKSDGKESVESSDDKAAPSA